MKTVLLIIAVFLLLCCVAGYVMLRIACGRKQKEDFFDPDVLERLAPYKKEETLRNRDWYHAKPDVETVTVCSTEGFRLTGHWVPWSGADEACRTAVPDGAFYEGAAPRGTVICFHGWHGSWKSSYTCYLQFFNGLGYNVLAIEERAHDQSEGNYLTFGVRERFDVRCWISFVAEKTADAEHPGGLPIFLHGISMGSATVQMASDLDLGGDVRGIIADCGFTSPYDIMRCVITGSNALPPKKRPLPTGFLLFLLNIFTTAFAGFSLREWSSAEAVSHSHYPILFIHGTGDTFVPCHMSEENYSACTSEKELILVPEAAHTMSYFIDRERVSRAEIDFLARYN